MSSQKSIESSRQPVQPQRKRGHERVAAIVEAAVDLFATQEYSAVTMTEIAARSGTAIGSLYRFFPTKGHVADAILTRYGELIRCEFDACAAQAGNRPITDTAGDLIQRFTALGRYRAAGIALVDARDEQGAPINDQIGRIRGAMRGGIGRVLAAIEPQRSPTEISARALTVLQVLKAATNTMKRTEHERAVLCHELRHMLTLYLTDVHATPSSDESHPALS